MKRRLVLVEWDDAANGNVWTNRDLPIHVDSIISIGILVRENDREIELNSTLGKEFKLLQLAIPKNTIKRMRQLQVVQD
jgi:hypothetical protein